MLLLNLPVILLTILVGICCIVPEVTVWLTQTVLSLARFLGLKVETLLMLTMLVPVLQALLLHSNRRHGLGGGRWIIYSAFFCSPVIFAGLYYVGVLLMFNTPAE